MLQSNCKNTSLKKCGTENCFLCARDTIYMMRNGNFRNNQMLMDLYIMGVESMINMDDMDTSFLNEGMTIEIEIPGLAVRKLYYDILLEQIEDIYIQLMRKLIRYWQQQKM
jgi:hypothetical protein